MIDAHLHLQDARLSGELDSILAEMRSAGITRWAVNGTGPDDWNEVALLAATHSETVAGYGVHPWKVNSIPNHWESELLERLQNDPDSFVGEIGLDKWIRGHRIEHQKEIFTRQLDIANEFERPATIHCLRAWGHLLDCLRETPLSKPFLLHSFSGPREMIPELLDFGAFFSISGYFFRPDKGEKLSLFSDIPDERILLETDAPDMQPTEKLIKHHLKDQEGNAINHPANLTAIYQAFTDWRSMDDLESTVALMEKNFAQFLN